MKTAVSSRVPLLVQITGASMEPNLPVGSTVWVDETTPPTLLPGDVVLIEGGSGWIVHRIVWLAKWRGRTRLFHRGDCEGGVGLCELRSVRGRVVSIVAPDHMPIPTVDDLSAGFRRRFRWTQQRCRMYALGAAIAPDWGARWLRRLGSRLLGGSAIGSIGRG